MKVGEMNLCGGSLLIVNTKGELFELLLISVF